MNNIEVFNDTHQRIKNNIQLRALTEKAAAHTFVIDEGFRSAKTPSFANPSVTFQENLTLIAAKKFVDAGKKTAVLNFANPVEPGGGVLRGAKAQEEYLCRASNLYSCLIGENADAYYRYHISLLSKNQFRSMFLATDKIIYSSAVTIIKEDCGYIPDDTCSPTQEYTDDWYSVDVITCAAPYFRNSEYMLPNGDLYHIFCTRIRNILESAIENDVEALVLGAFGCGAFNNPPSVVAQAFKDVLLEERYLNAFSDVTFAVKRSGWFSENIEAFEMAFNDNHIK